MSPKPHSVTSNARWVLLAQGSRVGTQLIALVAYSRILGPTEYGLMAMAMTVVNMSFFLLDLGLGQALIQSKELHAKTISSTFALNVVIAAFALLLVSASSPLVADFFGQPQLIGLLSLLALVFPINAMFVVPRALMERESEFRTVAFIEASSAWVGCTIGIVVAVLTHSVYSMAVQLLVTAALALLAFWRTTKWRPEQGISISALSPIAQFSLRVTAFNTLNYVARNADRLLVGRWMGAAATGIYTLAYSIMLFPVQSMTVVVTRSLLPAMSRRFYQDGEAQRLYLRALNVIALFTAPMMLGIWAIREDLILLIFGHAWLRSATLLAWLAPTGMLQALISVSGTVFMAAGRPDILLRVGIASTTLSLIAFAGGVLVSLEALVCFYFLANVGHLVIATAAISRLLGMRLSSSLRTVMPSLLVAAVMAVFVRHMVVPYFAETTAGAVRVLIAALAGCAFYGVVMLSVSKSTLSEIKAILR